VTQGRGALRRLRQLHLAGFVHNDVKPANILLGAGSARQAAEINLIDFGLATRAVGEPVVPAESDGSDEPIGTPTFASVAAHERRRAMRPADDLEALVYTLAYLAAGGLPWQGQPCSCAASSKRAMLTHGCEQLVGAGEGGSLSAYVHSPELAEMLGALWEQVRRCHHDASRGANFVDYEACLAALGAADEYDVPFDWELEPGEFGLWDLSNRFAGFSPG